MKTYVQTPVGFLEIRADEESVQGIQFVSRAGRRETSKVLTKAQKQLEQYIHGRSASFDLPFSEQGTPFQRRVWETARSIPAGKTVSYLELAKKIGKPTAYRAVANALGKNPYCIVVPCHRVIQTSGKLGGYNGGVHRKKWLLALEQH